MASSIIAAAWGAAEATCFFIVPDVWITRATIHSPKRGVAAAFAALGGALAGGVATFFWSQNTTPRESKRLLRKLPAISGDMIDKADAEVARVGNRGMLWGPLRGVPYKIYARAAGTQRQSFLGFLAWSVPARIPRFLLVVALSMGLIAGARKILPDGQTEKLAPRIHLGFWIAFYSWYLSVVGREPRTGSNAH
ncbi:hypothetical protein [Gulosibacter molinativorax]|uniref:DedA family protein n=1 Tax=Gulosibacter molinativorax TaxID=256821 RepID=A0ABT7C5S0_9MICO|nr:hypothetical protein [Gulosibacter molinativorax]MDJ1370540.1 hypothetical protein [Gulosibacter molinativorax]QUY62047.1 Hypothetical protein GMOLON4_1342 [Gulosibacter molinativorax]